MKRLADLRPISRTYVRRLLVFGGLPHVVLPSVVLLCGVLIVWSRGGGECGAAETALDAVPEQVTLINRHIRRGWTDRKLKPSKPSPEPLPAIAEL